MNNKKILFVCFKKYSSILEGGGKANQRNIDMATTVLGENNVDVIYIHDESKKRGLLQLVISCFWMLFGFWNGLKPSIVNNICDKSENYDAVFLSTSLFGVIAKALKEKGYGGRVYSHFHNIESKYYGDLIPWYNPLRFLGVNCAQKNDRYSCMYADTIIALNQRDSNVMKQLYGKGADYITPIAMKDTFDESKYNRTLQISKKPLCTFIGSSFSANDEGVLWFVKYVLPEVDIKFKVVGKGMASLKERYKELSGIDVLSDVPDLAPYFEEADFMILPIFSGSGMKVKTCEALMYGKNILGTDETFEGYELDAQKVGGRCNTKEDYIRKINYFIQNPILKYNRYSRSVFLEKYSTEATIGLYKQIFS